jgi:hypothetical protein
VDTKANDPEEWGKEWTDMSQKLDTGHINSSYPTDGRDTIYPPYERIAPTGTIAEYFAAGERIGNADPTLPPHYANYHAQRTGWPEDELHRLSPGTPLDAKGNPIG